MENNNDVKASEVLEMDPKFRWRIYLDRCTLCGECVYACDLELLQIENEMVIIEEGGCTQCGDCAAACGYHAITFS